MAVLGGYQLVAKVHGRKYQEWSTYEHVHAKDLLIAILRECKRKHSKCEGG
jgi:hypothetical protein